MTLQRRVLLYLLIGAALVWAAGLWLARDHVHDEIDELFDTQQVQLARQVLSLLPAAAPVHDAVPQPLATPAAPELGAAHLADLSIAAWSREGRLLLAGNDGAGLPYRAASDGFVDQQIDGLLWRVYYQHAPAEGWQVAVGQRSEERAELVRAILDSQLLPWGLTLLALLLTMAAAVRQALKPMRTLTGELRHRRADELQPLAADRLPTDLLPLVQAMNGLLRRIGSQVEHERRFTADAAHELRTPLAALRAQWDAAQLEPRRHASSADPKISEGLERLERLVTQMLALSRLEHLDPHCARLPIDWPLLVERLFSEVLPLAEQRGVELECEWPAQGQRPLLDHGDADLLALMLRNLLDNALRHSQPRGHVTLRLAADAIEVLDAGPGVPAAQRPRLGDRFFRLPGQGGSGSGLGLSIVRRIATLHGLAVDWHDATDDAAAPGLRVRLSAAAQAAGD